MPSRRTHRGRLRIESRRDDAGEEVGKTLVLSLKPSKTDPTGIPAPSSDLACARDCDFSLSSRRKGEKGFEVYYPLDDDPDSLCAGTAILAMLRRDFNVGPRDQNPLFRDPRTGLELTYEDAARELKRLLLLIGESALAHGLHSLRRGGATAVANDDAGGSLTAGFMGHWASNAKFGYMFALRQKVERAALAIGRAHRDAGPVAVRPGPVNSYAGGRA